MRLNEKASLRVLVVWMAILLSFPLITYRKLIQPMDLAIEMAETGMERLTAARERAGAESKELDKYTSTLDSIEKERSSMLPAVPFSDELAEFGAALANQASEFSIIVGNIEFQRAAEYSPGVLSKTLCTFSFKGPSGAIDKLLGTFGRSYPLTGIESFSLSPADQSEGKKFHLEEFMERGKVVLGIMTVHGERTL